MFPGGQLSTLGLFEDHPEESSENVCDFEKVLSGIGFKKWTKIVLSDYVVARLATS